MQKLDRLFTDANDQGLYLLVHGLGELGWDRGRPHAERLLAMLGARYAAHYVSFASHMAEPAEPRHEQIQAAIAHGAAPPRDAASRGGCRLAQAPSGRPVLR